LKEKLRDIDYAYATARVRALEKNLLTRERLERILEAKTDEDAVKVLSECGYPSVSSLSLSEIEKMLAKERLKLFDETLRMSPDRRIVDLFLIKYDYHNLKAIIKGEAKGADYDSSLIDAGRIRTKAMKVMLLESNYHEMPPAMGAAVSEAREVLSCTSDPQTSDIILDKACYQEMLSVATEIGNEVIKGYVRLLIDSVNLRACVRLKRMGRSFEYLRRAYIPGGNVSVSKLSAEITPELLGNIYAHTALQKAAEAGIAALKGDLGLSFLDLECDNALLSYLKSAKYVAFGESPLAAYLAAKETELTAVRIVLTGRLAGLSPETVMESLRDTYV